MQNTIDETNRRREKQLSYNEKNNITPQQIIKAHRSLLGEMRQERKFYTEPEGTNVAADPVVRYMESDALQKAIDKTRKSMEKAAQKLDFIEAARLRDEMYELEKILKTR